MTIDWRSWFSNIIIVKCKGLLGLLKLLQAEAHRVHFSFRCQPEIKIQSPRSHKVHRLIRLPKWQEVLTVKSNGGTLPRARIHAHLLVLKVHDNTQGLDDGSAAEKWGLSRKQEDLSLAKPASDAHWKLHHPVAPTFTVTSKVEFVPASVELDIFDGVSQRGQVLQVASGWSKSTEECRSTWI